MPFSRYFCFLVLILYLHKWLPVLAAALPPIADFIVQTCGDADRLDLGRVGTTPKPLTFVTQTKKRTSRFQLSHWFILVGAIGFEPTTPSPPAKCATRLRHAPTFLFHKYNLQKCINIFLRQ